MNKIEVRYIGYNSILLHCKFFSGIVKQNDTVWVSSNEFDNDLKNNVNWELVKSKKKGKNNK